MKLVVGLGNPGPQYVLNRHNAGFLLVDTLADRYAFKDPKRHGQGFVAEGMIAQSRVLLLKPLTYMNLSGHAVAEVIRFFKISLDDVLVIHDDLDLPFGTVRVKKGGGHGGHNGLKSLDACIGKEYWRLRLGIGHPGHKDAVTGHVLGNFSKAEQDELVIWLREITDAFPYLLTGNTEKFMSAITANQVPSKSSKGDKNGI
jgi:PTH1 family peptidyl-tRNA hydrolase